MLIVQIQVCFLVHPQRFHVHGRTYLKTWIFSTLLFSFSDRKKDLVKLQHGEYVSLAQVSLSTYKPDIYTAFNCLMRFNQIWKLRGLSSLKLLFSSLGLGRDPQTYADFNQYSAGHFSTFKSGEKNADLVWNWLSLVWNVECLCTSNICRFNSRMDRFSHL